MLAVEIWGLSCKSNSLPVDRKYQKGNLRENCKILLFNSKYKRRWINVIFLQDIHDINTLIYVYSTQSLPYIPVLSILRHCTNIVYLGTDHFTWKGQGVGLWFFVSFRNFFSDNTRVKILIFLSRKARIFFPAFNIRLYDKNSESDYFFFFHLNQNIFFSNIGNQNIFLEKKHNPLQVKWSFPYDNVYEQYILSVST
jgi:hypothetical protein